MKNLELREIPILKIYKSNRKSSSNTTFFSCYAHVGDGSPLAKDQTAFDSPTAADYFITNCFKKFLKLDEK